MSRFFFTYIVILIGASIQGIAMAVFLFPHSIPSGGAAGIAILLNYWLHLPLGFSLWLANFTFLLFALKYFGYSWTMRTMIAVATTSIVVSVISNIYIMHIQIVFDILLGSILFGIGVGLLIRCGSSSGGMVIPALMISTHYKISPGKIMLIINLVIFILTASVINIKIVFYAIICQAISTRIIDFIYSLKFPISPIHQLGWRKK